MRSARLWYIFALLLIFLSGCSPYRQNEQPNVDERKSFQPGKFIGQSFVASYDGLSGVDVLFTPDRAGQKITLDLYSDSQLKNKLATSEVLAKGEPEERFYTFAFLPVKQSSKGSYYFDLHVQNGNLPRFGISGGDSYLDGSLYVDHQPVNAQLTFRLTYDPINALAGLFGEFAGFMLQSFLAGILFVLPGWALLRLSLQETWLERYWTEKLALASGVGLSLYPVLMLWANLVGLHLALLYTWIPIGIAAIYLLYVNRQSLSSLQKRHFALKWNTAPFAADAVFVVLLFLVFITRFWATRTVEAPLWGDSVQHSVIAQLIADHQGLFDTWQPYTNYQGLTVQYGFSAAIAAWMWFSGMASAQATVFLGQIASVFAVLSLYPLALLISRGNCWAGNASLMIGGLLSWMPAFYVNWGRYPQLYGSAIIPVAACLLWYWLNCRQPLWRQVFINALVVVGTLLAYYRMAFYYVLFVPVLLGILYTQEKSRPPFRQWMGSIIKVAVLALLCLVLVSPWLSNVTGSNLSEQVGSGIVKQTALQGIITEYQQWKDVQTYVPLALIVLAAISVIVGIIKRHWEVLWVVVWALLVSAVKAGSLLHLPGANMMTSFVVLISLYIFASLLVGWLFGWFIEFITVRSFSWGTILGVALLVILGCYGLIRQKNVSQPTHFALVTRPDLQAMTWIRSNTSPDSVFLVEGFRINNGASIVGSDAGWWIPLLSGRKNTMPPQYALLSERPDPPSYSKDVVDLVKTLETYSPVDSASWRDLCRMGVTHIYVGQRQGRASDEKIQLFPPDLPDPSGLIRLVYAQDRVRIYAVSKDICAERTSH